jgi:hypothetical protein
MAKVTPGRFGGSLPRLTPEDLEGDAAILTIAAYEEVEVPDNEDPSGRRFSATLSFEETGDKVLWLNKSMVEALVSRLGDESDDWIGQQVPVEKTTVIYKGQEYHKVRVMPAAEWDEAFREAGVRVKGKPTAPARPTRRK